MHGGGSERQLVSLLQHLNRDQFQPHLYLVYRSGPLLDEVPKDVPIVSFDERVRGSRIYFPGLMHRRRVNDLARYLQEVSADVSYDRTFLMTLIAAEAAQSVGVPNVSTVVTDPAKGFAPVAGRFQSFKKRMLTRLYSSSAKVLANSEGAARSAEAFYQLNSNSVDVHYNGVDIETVRSKAQCTLDDPWWVAPSAKELVFRIISAGRLNTEKGFHLLIDAVAHLKLLHSDIEFRLAILGEGAGRAALENQIERLFLKDSVRLMGFRSDAPAWYKSADVFVLPSYLEGMPNVLLEAMAVGTPVVSTDCPSGPREILGDNQFGVLVEVGSVESLVSGIQRVRDDSSLKIQTAAAADRVESAFSIQAATKNLEQIFKHVLGR